MSCQIRTIVRGQLEARRDQYHYVIDEFVKDEFMKKEDDNYKC